VTHEPVRHGAVIAAGTGRRFHEAGWALPKPMVPVAGVPLIEHAIRHFQAAGIASLVVLVNERDRACAGWIRSRFPEMDLELVVKTTASSLESFREVLARSPAGSRTLVSTVDAWCPDAEFVRFVATASAHAAEATVLGVTPLVADERPLWVTLDAAGRVTRLGDPAGALVTAGLYLVPDRVRRLSPPRDLASLREFLAWLVDQGEPVDGVVLPRVVDVDRPEDVLLAEAWAEEIRGASIGAGGAPR
jgi:NDP-sugar pyrophosphorylase family protein